MLTAVRLPCHVSRASLSLYFLVYSAKDIRELRAFTDPSPSWEHALAVLKPHFDPTVTVPGLQVRTRRTSVTQSQASTDNASGITPRGPGDPLAVRGASAEGELECSYGDSGCTVTVICMY